MARKRRQDKSLPHHFRLGDFHNGYYECCFVSPWTKSAHNADAEVMLLGQDWSSSDRLNQPRDREQRRLGQIWDLPANRNLREFLKNFRLEFCETYATNDFPFMKRGPMAAPIPAADMRYCAEEYALRQIELISPKIAICLGARTFEALRQSLGKERRPFAEAFKPERCINYLNTEIYGIPHPGNLGVINGGGVEQIHERWQVLGKRLGELRRT